MMITRYLEVKFRTKGKYDFLDLTDRVESFLKKCRVSQGLVNVQSKHTSAAVYVNENEPLLIKDFRQNWEKLFSPRGRYNHDNFEIRTVNMCQGECQNGHSHCNAVLLDTSVTLNIIKGKLDFGRWQRIFFVELDRARPRQVSLLVMGEQRLIRKKSK